MACNLEFYLKSFRLRHSHRPFFPAQGKLELSPSSREGKAFRVNVTLNFPCTRGVSLDAGPGRRTRGQDYNFLRDNFHLDT